MSVGYFQAASTRALSFGGMAGLAHASAAVDVEVASMASPGKSAMLDVAGIQDMLSSMWLEVAIFLVVFAVVRAVSVSASRKAPVKREAKKVCHPDDDFEPVAKRDHSPKSPARNDEFGIQLDRFAAEGDAEAASQAVERARAKGVQLVAAHYEALLKAYVKGKDNRCIETYDAMLSAGFTPCEGLCRFLIARSAESRDAAFARHIADDLRKRKEMTFMTYKALMKVYAFANLYGEACDLYAELQAAGMEPDSIMYSSLMKFAVKAGRNDLAQELFAKVDMTKLEEGIQPFMWFIRSACQEGNAEKAVEAFRKLQQAQPALIDTMALNAVIDACVSNKDMKRALSLLEEMRGAVKFNLVTYSTLLKGHMIACDLESARSVLSEMDEAGIAPDGASLSCLVHCAVRAGSMDDVWSAIEEYDKRGVPVDSYALTAMMHAIKRVQNQREASRILAILDRPDVNCTKDDVLFNTTLDACLNCRDHRRLQRLVDAYSSSTLQPNVRTFGLLIRACNVLRCTSRCKEFWSEMIDRHGLTPSDITLGCMVDALVEARNVEEALALFETWKDKVHCDTIVYSTLIKGCASSGDASRAMDLYTEMRERGVTVNHIAYSSLINAQARHGSMEVAERLLEVMQKEGCEANAITYSAIVKGHCVRGHLEAALDLFQRMINNGVAPDTIIFNTLLDGCVQQARFELSDELLAQMRRQGIAMSNYTLSIVVKMWSKRRNLDKAFACVREALKNPRACGHVDAQVGACIVGACMHNRAPERAIEVFEEMKTWPDFDGPDANTYSALISGLPRHGMVQKAVELAEEACFALRATARGQDRRLLAPNSLQQLYGALKAEGLIEDLGRPLAGKLRAAGMRVEAQWLARQ